MPGTSKRRLSYSRGNVFHYFHGPPKSGPKVTQMGTKMEPKSIKVSSGGGNKKKTLKKCAEVPKMMPRASPKGDQKALKIDEKSTSAPLGVFRGSWGGYPLQKGVQNR